MHIIVYDVMMSYGLSVATWAEKRERLSDLIRLARISNQQQNFNIISCHTLDRELFCTLYSVLVNSHSWQRQPPTQIEFPPGSHHRMHMGQPTLGHLGSSDDRLHGFFWPVSCYINSKLGGWICSAMNQKTCTDIDGISHAVALDHNTGSSLL